jgi:hypothetical protein
VYIRFSAPKQSTTKKLRPRDPCFIDLFESPRCMLYRHFFKLSRNAARLSTCVHAHICACSTQTLCDTKRSTKALMIQKIAAWLPACSQTCVFHGIMPLVHRRNARVKEQELWAFYVGTDLMLLLLQVGMALNDLHLVDDQPQQIWHVFAVHDHLQATTLLSLTLSDACICSLMIAHVCYQVPHASQLWVTSPFHPSNRFYSVCSTCIS